MANRNFFKSASRVTLFASLVILTGCASYHAMPLTSVCCDTIQMHTGNPSDVVVVAKAFNKYECKRYLDRDVLSKGFQPIQIYIDNESDHNYLFSLNRVGLPCACPEYVSEKVHTSTVARATGYGVAALFFWPFAIPAVIDGFKSAQANEALDHDFMRKAAKDQVIAAQSHVNVLLFVPINNYQPTFNITLIDLKTNQPREFVVQAN